MNEVNESETVVVSGDDEIILFEIIGLLWKYRKIIILTTLFGAVGAVVFSIISIVLPPEKSYLPNLYASTAKLLINEDSSGSVLSSGMSNLASLAGISVGGNSSYGRLAVDLAKSNSIVDVITDEFDIINRYEIKKYPQYSSRKEIRERLAVGLDEDTHVLSISYLDRDPEFSRDVANRVVELLDARFATIGINRNMSQKNLLEEKLVSVNAEIASFEAEIKAFQEEYGVLSVEQIATVQVKSLAELKSQLILKELEIKTYTQFSRIEDPVISRMRTERDNLDKLIKQMEQGENRGEYSQTGPSIKELPDLALQFSHMQRELMVQTEIYKLLTQEYEMTKLKVEGEGPIFQVLELGEVSDRKSEPMRSRICIIVTLAFFILAVAGVFGHNSWRNIKKDPKKMAKLRGK